MRASLSLLLAVAFGLSVFGYGGYGGSSLASAWAAESPVDAPARGREVATGVAVRCTIDVADIFIDGDRIGQTPLVAAIPLAVGEHTIRVSRLGFTPYIDVFKVRKGQVTKLEVELVPIAGVLRLNIDRDRQGAPGRVYVDDRYIGDLPIETEVELGSHDVRIERGGYYPQSFPINAMAGQVVERSITLVALPADKNPYQRKPPPVARWYQKWWVWTIGAVGVAAVATAVIVPVVLSRRDACNGVDVCASAGAKAQGVSGLQIAF